MFPDPPGELRSRPIVCRSQIGFPDVSASISAVFIYRLSSISEGVNCFLSYLRLGLFIDRGEECDVVFLFRQGSPRLPHAVWRSVALLCGGCVEGSLGAGISHVPVAKYIREEAPVAVDGRALLTLELVHLQNRNPCFFSIFPAHIVFLDLL